MIDFKIYTSKNGPLSPEQLAEMAVNEIVNVSDTAPSLFVIKLTHSVKKSRPSLRSTCGRVSTHILNT